MGWRSGGNGGDGADAARAGGRGESEGGGVNLWHWQSHRTGSRRRSPSLGDLIGGGNKENEVSEEK